MITQPRYQGKGQSPQCPSHPRVVGQNGPETQAQIPPGTTPDASSPTGAPPGSSATALDLAFSRPCPRCRATVSLSWSPILTAVLDRLDALETGYHEDLPGGTRRVTRRLLWVEAAVRALQGEGEEGQL